MGRNGRVPAPGLEPGQTESKSVGLPITPCRTAPPRTSTKRRFYDTEPPTDARALMAANRTPTSWDWLLRRREVGLGLGHGRARPAFDPPVEVRALPDGDAEATVVAVAHVLAHGPWVVALQSCPPELVRCSGGQGQPELLGRRNVGALVDLHPVYK